MAQVYFTTNVEQVARLCELSVKGMESLASEGPTDEQLTRTVENFRKKMPESRISNNYWLNVLQGYYSAGIDRDTEYEAAIAEINAENIKAAVKALLDEGNFIEVVMGPAE